MLKSNVNYAKKKIREQVLRLEKQGTKLYGLAPIPFFLWLMRQFDTTIKMEAPASGTAGSFASVQNVMNAITQNSVLTGAAVKSAVATAGKAAGGAALSKGAIAAIIVTVAVGGGIGSYAAYSSAAGQQAQETAVISEAESAEEPAMISEAESTVEPAVISEAESTEEPTAVSESAPSENPEDTDYISLYVSKYTELEQTYGKASSTYEYGDYFELIKGLCFAKLADFDEDGIPEMITVHQETDGTNHSVTIDVWGINGNRIINLFNRVKTDSHIVKNHYGSFSELHNSGTNIHVIQLVEAKGKLQMVTDHYSSYESIEYEYGTVKNGVFETHTYRYGFGGEAGPIAPFYIDGAEVSEEEFKESFPYYHYDGLNKSFGFIGHDFKGQYQFSGGDDVSVIYNELEETRKELGLSVKVGPAQDAILQ